MSTRLISPESGALSRMLKQKRIGKTYSSAVRVNPKSVIEFATTLAVCFWLQTIDVTNDVYLIIINNTSIHFGNMFSFSHEFRVKFFSLFFLCRPAICDCSSVDSTPRRSSDVRQMFSLFSLAFDGIDHGSSTRWISRGGQFGKRKRQFEVIETYRMRLYNFICRPETESKDTFFFDSSLRLRFFLLIFSLFLVFFFIFSLICVAFFAFVVFSIFIYWVLCSAFCRWISFTESTTRCRKVYFHFTSSSDRFSGPVN